MDSLVSWAFVVCDRNGNAIAQPLASGRQYNPAISGTETASFQVRVGSPLWEAMQAFETTVKVYDSFGVLQFYGDVATDELVASSKTVQVTASDLSARFASRYVGKDQTGVGLSYVNQDARAIAFDLLTQVNAEAPTGVIPGTGNVGLSTAPAFTPVAGTFGKTTRGTSAESIYGDQFHGAGTGELNKRVSRFMLGERATVSSISMDVAFGSDGQATFVKGVMYADNGGVPGALVGQTSATQLNFGGTGVPRQFVTFTGMAATVNPGNYWLGYIAGETSKQGVIYVDGGGSRYMANDAYGDGPSANFGTTASDGIRMAVYASYMTAAPVPSATAFVGPTVTYLWKKLSDAINELGAIASSYEWKLRYVDGAPPTCYLDLVTEVGSDKSSSVFFEYGIGKNNCADLRRVGNATQRATRVYALGSAQTLLGTAFDSAAETEPFARAEDVLSVSDITDATLLGALATQHVAVRKTPRRVFTVEPAPKIAPRYGEWTVGDYVTLRGKVDDVILVDGIARAWGAQIGIDEFGNEDARPVLEPTS